MANDQLKERVARIYAAIGETVDDDLSKFKPTITVSGHTTTYRFDVSGGLNPAQLSNLAHNLIHNIANLFDHLKRWPKQNSRDSQQVESLATNSRAIQIIRDLSNNDKHGSPPRDGGYSKLSPQLVDVSRVMRLTTGPMIGSSSIVMLTPTGPAHVGDGRADVIVTGRVLDASGSVVGDLQNLCTEAITAWEVGLRSFGISA